MQTELTGFSRETPALRHGDHYAGLQRLEAMKAETEHDARVALCRVALYCAPMQKE